MIKVVHMITELAIGGAQFNTVYTTTHLDKKKFQADLWTGNKESVLRREISPLRDFKALIYIVRGLRTHKPDIIHTHSSKAGIIGRLAAWWAGVPVIIHTYHGFGFNDEQVFFVRWFFVWLEKMVAKITTHFVFVSHDNLEKAKRLGIGTPYNVSLIRSGIDIELTQRRAMASSREIMRLTLRLRPGVRVVTTIGCFKPQKNLVDFLHAAAFIRSEIPTAHFLIIGDGEQRPKLEKLIKFLELQGVVHLLGWRDDIPELLAASDVFAMTSLWEGLPRALIEAVCVGLPAVCYATDGIKDLQNWNNVYMVERTPLDLGKQIVELLKGPGYKIYSTEDPIQQFDIKDMVAQQEELYERLMRKNK